MKYGIYKSYVAMFKYFDKYMKFGFIFFMCRFFLIQIKSNANVQLIWFEIKNNPLQ